MHALSFMLLYLGSLIIGRAGSAPRRSVGFLLAAAAYIPIFMWYPNELALPIWMAIAIIAGVSSVIVPCTVQFALNVLGSAGRQRSGSQASKKIRSRTRIYMHVVLLIGVSVVSACILILPIYLLPGIASGIADAASFLAPLVWVALCIACYISDDEYRAWRIMIPSGLSALLIVFLIVFR